LLLAALPIGYGVAFVWQSLKDLPDITLLEKYEPIEAIQIFDKFDHLICTVEGDEDRRVVPLTAVSTQMQQAILAAEDHHFYEHHGINFMSIGRALLTNVQAGKVKEGGSTITQQLVKNLFFEDAKRTFDRKIKEAFISYEVESRYPKEKILEMYLNQVYFGNGGYGIERGAQRYFGKTAGQLTLAEAAFLAGLVKAPTEMGNVQNRGASVERQHEILGKMVEYGYVTKGQAEQAKKQKLVFKKTVNPLQKYPFYISYVLEQLRQHFSAAEMRRQGLRVYSNVDPQAQELAEKVLAEEIKKAPPGVSQGALVSVSVRDGAVIALVGGVGDFWKNQWNRATNPHTAGSSFKPFVYLTALARGIYRADSLIEDTPITIKQGWGLPDWSPKNFDHKFMGKVTIRKALALSRNVPAVRVGKAVGIDKVVETARLCGITTRLDQNLSLSLGSSAVTPLDMAGAYATFARGGITIKPQVIRRVENNRGQVIHNFESRVDKTFDSEAVARLLDILQDVVKYGTGTGAKLKDRPVAGKTGTADAAKDIWFIGFTPDLVTSVWGGNDENKSIPGHNVTGGVVMAKIWKHYMEDYYKTHPTAAGSFIAPSRMLDVELEQKDHQEATPTVPKLVPLTPQLGAEEEIVEGDQTASSGESSAPIPGDGPSTATGPAPLAPADIPASAPTPAPTPTPTPTAPSNLSPMEQTAPPLPTPAPSAVPSAMVAPAVAPPIAPAVTSPTTSATAPAPAPAYKPTVRTSSTPSVMQWSDGKRFSPSDTGATPVSGRRFSSPGTPAGSGF
jgi:penicillin-binding protein 1A